MNRHIDFWVFANTRLTTRLDRLQPLWTKRSESSCKPVMHHVTVCVSTALRRKDIYSEIWL